MLAVVVVTGLGWSLPATPPGVPQHYFGDQRISHEVDPKTTVSHGDTEEQESDVTQVVEFPLRRKKRPPSHTAPPEQRPSSLGRPPLNQLAPGPGKQVGHAVESALTWRVFRSLWKSRA